MPEETVELNERIIQQCESKLRILATEELACKSSLQTLAFEVAALNEKKRDRMLHFAAAESALIDARKAAYQQALHSALLLGTAAHANAIAATHAAEQVVSRLESDYALIHKSVEEENAVAEERLTAVIQEQKQHTDRLATIPQEKAALEHEQRAAQHHIGILVLAQEQAKLAEVRKQQEHLEAELAQMQIQHTQQLEASIAVLAAWPEQKTVLLQQQPEKTDAVTESLSLFLQLLDSLLKNNGQHLQALARLASIRTNNINWRDVFLIDQDLLYLTASIHKENPALIRKRAAIAKLLQEYTVAAGYAQQTVQKKTPEQIAAEQAIIERKIQLWSARSIL